MGADIRKPTAERRQGAECRAYHCTILPIKDGRFAYKEIFAGKDKFEYSQGMKQLHTDFFAEANTKWEISRDRSAAETGARHRAALSEEWTQENPDSCSSINKYVVVD